jgi:hypothetical protein
MKQKERFLKIFLIMAAYIGCIIWIADGYVIPPHFKIMIVGIGAAMLFLSVMNTE